ncbi:MAG: hypothetical protein ACRCZM_05900, partial [Bacteroidales bacterium]
PQYLNALINGSRGISDSFIDKFNSTYSINQIELFETNSKPNLEPNDNSLSQRLMDKLDSKDQKIDSLIERIIDLTSEVERLKAQLDRERESAGVARSSIADAG